MATEKDVQDALFEGINRPYRGLPEMLDAAMRALAGRIPLTRLALELHGVGTLLLGRSGSQINTDWLSHRGTAGPAMAGDAPVAIRYAGRPVGALSLYPTGAAAAPLVDGVARQCAFLAKRYEALGWAERRLDRPLLLVGLSRPLRMLDGFVETAAGSPLPVLLRGEFGTEKTPVAAMIHSAGPNPDGPFIHVDCSGPEGTPLRWIERAASGTLYLDSVDELAPLLQQQLSQHLPVVHPSLPSKVRVVASTTADLRQRAGDGTFSPALLAGLDFLSATIPPLRERRDDIHALIWRALERNGHRPQEQCSDALTLACQSHDWPENLVELERSIARLATLAGGGPIALEDLRRHAPALAAESESGADRWTGCAITGDPAALASLHPGLRKALITLGAHYHQPISLDRLAREAGVSPSHLGFLFRSVLGLPFKALLGRIRIRKAREMLAAGTRPNITEVALSVGFSDLSHFEKSFRRIVGQSPREFRRNAAA